MAWPEGSGSSRGCRTGTSARPDPSAAEADGLPDRFRPDDTRASYDVVARRYADEIARELDSKPFDRQFLDRFARSLSGSGRVVEMGSGPAHVAAYLAARGVEMEALDLSPNMIREAHRLFPTLPARVGDMLDLPYDDGSLAGAISFYSIIHFDDPQLARAFAEIRRVLVAEGLLALAFHIGDEVVRREQWWDMPVVLDARFLPREHVEALLHGAGFEVVSAEERTPYAPEVEYGSRRAYLVARPLVPIPGRERGLPPLYLGHPRTDLRRRLVDLVLSRDKAATAGLAEDHAPHTHAPLPRPRDEWALLGFDDEPVAIVETTRVEVVPAGQVSLEFARAEGEGFESVAAWRAAHERFWSARRISDDTPIVCEYFRVIETI